MGRNVTTRLSIFTALLCTAVLAALLPATAFALPAYAAATGQACSVCHVNPAGGGARTAKGQAFAAVSTHATNPAGAWAQINAAPAAPAPAAPAPAAPAAPRPAPAAPAAPAAPVAGNAPSTLPTTGDAGTASQIPIALMYLSAAFAGLGLSLRRR